MAAQRARAPWVLAFCAGGALFGCSLVLPFDEDKLTGGAAGSGGAGTGGVSSGGSPTSSGPGTTSSSAGGSSVTSSASTGGATSSSASTGGATSSSASTGSGGSGVIVQCGQPTPVDCAPGQVCCYDQVSPFNDFCAPSGDCGPAMEYGELACEGPEDCGGQPCCALFAWDMMDIKATYCDTACNLDFFELSSCLTDADCGPGATCETPLGQEYTTYHFCVF